MSDISSENRENFDESRKYCVFISERSQKITEALYRVTDLFPEEEPLKWVLRKIGLEIHHDISSLTRKDVLHENTRSLKIVFGDFSQIISLLELASAGSFISQINFEVLRREYSALRDFIEDKKKELLPPSFNISSSHFLLQEKKGADKVSADFKSAKSFEENALDNGHSNGHSDISNSQYNGQREESGKTGDKFPVFGVKTKRQEIIVNFLKTGGWASIGQIISLFSDGISEKTIQRDLLDMAERGILDKEGDKRWRRYCLKS